MRKICLLVITLFAVVGIFNVQTLYAAAPKLEGPVVTVNNQVTKDIQIGVRKNTGDTCLPVPIILKPGEVHTINYADLAEGCRQDKTFLIDATRVLTHTALLNNTPGQCLIEPTLFSIKITCQP